MSASRIACAGVLAALVFLPVTPSFAFVAPEGQITSKSVAKLLSQGEVVVRPTTKSMTVRSFANRFDSKTTLEVDQLSGAVRLITGQLAIAPKAIHMLTASDLIDVATNWIASHEDVLQVQLDDTSLVESSTLMTDDVQFLRFNVSRNGVLIKDASINFRFKKGTLVQVQSLTFGEASDDNRGEFVSGTDAVDKLAPTAAVQEMGQVFRVRATERGYNLVRVNQSLVNIDGQNLVVQTDSASGKVFETRNTRFYVSGHAHGSPFERTYYQSQPIDANMLSMDITAGSGSVRADLDGNFTVTGSTAPKIAAVKGKHINIRTSTGTPVSKTAVDSNGVWDLNLAVSAEKDQAQVHTYYHLNLMVQKAKRYIDASWLDQVLTANVNLSQTCNAYWNGTTVNFFSAGNSCGNTGLISDVMYHEWGHGLDDNTGGIDDGAYSEGFGDIMSMVMTNDSKLGPGFRSNGGVVRDMDPDKVYPKDRGEVHAEGLIIGGTFWDLFKSLSAKYDANTANDIVSAIAFKTIFTAARYTDVYNAALVVNDNDTDTTTRSPDFCEINSAFSAHGLATKASDCP